VSYAELGRWSEAAEDYRNSIEQDVVSADFPVDELAEHLAALAKQDVDREAYVGLRELFAELTERFPENDPWPRNNTAWVLVRSNPGDPELVKLATRLTVEARAIRPDDGSIINTLGACHYRAGDWQKAVDTLLLARQYQKLESFGFDGYFIAMALARLNNPERAKVWFDTSDRWAASIAATSPELQQLRDEASATLGLKVEPLQPLTVTTEEKKALVDLMVAADPTAGWTHQKLGQYAADAGDKKQAAIEYQRAVNRLEDLAKKHPDERLFRDEQLDCFLALSSLANEAGDAADAKTYFEKATSIQSTLADKFDGFAGPLLPKPTKWKVQYYASNVLGVPNELSETLAQQPLAEKMLDRINLAWQFGSPDEKVPVDRFITVATTELELDAGEYEVQTVSDDGIRVWIADRLVIENWTGHPDTLDTATVSLPAGKHAIKVQHFESNFGATLKFGLFATNKAAEQP
jgi:tetratricopeptide (TPR) repeat protein